MEDRTRQFQQEYYRWLGRLNQREVDRDGFEQFVRKFHQHAEANAEDQVAWRVLAEAMVFSESFSTEQAIKARKRAYELSGRKNKKDRKWLELLDRPKKELPANAVAYYEKQFSPEKVGLSWEQLADLADYLDHVVCTALPPDADNHHHTRKWLQDSGMDLQSADRVIEGLKRFELRTDDLVFQAAADMTA